MARKTQPSAHPTRRALVLFVISILAGLLAVATATMYFLMPQIWPQKVAALQCPELQFAVSTDSDLKSHPNAASELQSQGFQFIGSTKREGETFYFFSRPTH